MQAQNEIEKHKGLFFIVLVFCVEIQASWLTLGRDPYGCSPFGSLGHQKPNVPAEITAGFNLMHPGMSIFQQNDMPFQRY